MVVSCLARRRFHFAFNDITRLSKLMRSFLSKLKQSKVWRTFKQAYARWAAEDGDQRAAAFAFYLLLSLLPLALLLVAAGSFFVEREVATEAIVSLINQYIPMTSEQERDAVVTIHDWLNSRGSISLTAVPLLVWGAMKYLRTLIRTTNRVWHVHTYNWWRLPLKSLGLLGITVSAVLIGVLLPMLGGLARQWLDPHLEFPPWAFGMLFFLTPGLVLFYGLIMIYRQAPSRSTQFSEVWHGALAATVLIWLGQRLFLFYATNLANFDALYGALGSIVAFLLWLYLSSSIAVFGICICAARVKVGERN